MAKGYQYREFTNFPNLALGEVWETITQMTFLEIADNSSDLHSRITYLGSSDYPQYYKYYVEHETVRDLKFRFQDKIRYKLIEIVEFHLYIDHNFEHLYADAKDKHVDSLLKRIADKHAAFKFAKRSVDLARMAQELKMNIRGGWFSNLKIADVSVAAVFGATVSDSMDWERYSFSGETSSIVADFKFNEGSTRILITQSGGIVVYESFSERDMMELVSSVGEVVGKFSELRAKDW